MENQIPSPARLVSSASFPHSEFKVSTAGLCGEIRAVLERHFSKNPHLSPVAFAYKIHLEEKRIFQLLERENDKPPTLTEIVAILTALYPGKSIAELARELPGAIGDYIRHEYQYFMGDQHYSFSGDLLDLLKRKENYIIYKLASNRSGVTLREIQRLFGVAGIENAKYMLRRDLVYLEKDRIFAKDPNYCLPNDMIVEAFKHTLDFLSTDADRSRATVFANISESLSKESYDRVREIQRRAIREIFDIVRDPNSKGDIPTFVIAAVDVLE